MILASVAIGSAVGAIVRALLGRLHAPGLLLANGAGTLVLAALSSAPVSNPLRFGVGVGFCGALTSMSALALAASDAPGRHRAALLFAHVCVGAIGVAIGTSIR